MTPSTRPDRARRELLRNLVVCAPWNVSSQERWESGVVVGADVATNDLLRALLAHGRFSKLSFLAQSEAGPLVERSLEGILAGSEQAKRKREVLELHRLEEQRDAPFRPHVIQCWEAAAGPLTYLRRHFFGASVPVLRMTHSISYPSMLHSTFLEMLLDMAPFDSLICTSPVAREAARNILESTRDRFNREFKVKTAFHGRLDVIPFGVDIERFRPAPKPEVREKLGIRKDAFVILWMGRFSLVDKMDLNPLVHLFADLRKRNPEKDLLLLLCGSFELLGYTKILEGLAKVHDLGESFRIARNVGNRETGERELCFQRELWFQAADVFVSPVDNIQECFGLTPVEAMACGVPQVVADWDGYRSTVLHGETGFLVPTYWTRCDGDLTRLSGMSDWMGDHFSLAQSVAVDPFQLRDDLQALIANDDLRERMARASRRRAQDVFGWKVVVRQYEDLWCELVREGRRSRWRPCAVDYRRPEYCKFFEHNPTTNLSPRTRLRLSEWALALFARATPLPVLGKPFSTFVSRSVVTALLGILAGRRRDTAVTFGRLVAEGVRTTGDHEDRVRRHVMWLIKYGYLRVEGAL
ncbi:MAG: glycosyltransferase family 4 protein [Deltaproteobacteria bacterium]|nr:glycosyltransferase family 4 protein [Deltaproteobacteria bacterium]